MLLHAAENAICRAFSPVPSICLSQLFLLSLIYGCNFDATVTVHVLLYISLICFEIALPSSS